MFLRKSRKIRKLFLGASLLIVVAVGAVAWFSRLAPVEAAFDATKFYATKMSAGQATSCAVGLNGRAYCWGSNASGQLGNGTVIDSAIPTPVNMTGVLAGKTILDISTKNTHTCAIASDYKAYCWGSGANGRLGTGNTTSSNVPVAVNMTGVLAGKNLLAIGTGDAHTCALSTESLVYCWGVNNAGQLGDGTLTQRLNPVQIDMTGYLAGKTLKTIDVGFGHNCSVASDNRAYCWGLNTTGQLGNPTLVPVTPTAASPLPIPVDATGAMAGKNMAATSLGSDHTCAYSTDGLGYCWGTGTAGQLGNSTTTTSYSPVAVTMTGALAGKTIKSIAARSDFTCSVASDSKAYCWGNGIQGRLGNGSAAIVSSPTPVDASGVLTGKLLSSVVAGSGYGCTIATDNQVFCWGNNGAGRLGVGPTPTETYVPLATLNYSPIAVQDVYRTYENANSINPGAPLAADNVPGQLAQSPTGDATDFRVRASVANATPQAKGWRAIAAGQLHTCGISLDGLAYCWGSNSFGQLGNGVTGGASSVPIAVTSSGALAGKTILSITAGVDYTCVIASDNLPYCWGGNGRGQLGDTTTATKNVPTAVNMSGLGGRTTQQISARVYTTCMTTNDGLAYCWGANNLSQIGDSTAVDKSVPTAVNGLAGRKIAQVGAGDVHACAMDVNGIMLCWGNSNFGQVGNNSSSGTASSATPVIMPAGVTARSFAIMYNTTCFVGSNNQAYCWGGGSGGQNANNSTSNVLVPTLIVPGAMAGKTVHSIHAGSFTFCAIASDRNSYCWGYGMDGELGNGALANGLTPVQVTNTGQLAGKTMLSMAGGQEYFCGLASDRNTYCWGNNAGTFGNGGSGVGTTVPSTPTLTTNINPAPEPEIAASTLYELHYAKRTQATCALQSVNSPASYAPVQNTGAIRWKVNAGVANNTVLTNGNAANDPATTYPFVYQAYRSTFGAVPVLTNIPAGNAGLWDFSLSDFSADKDSNYCFQLVNAGDGSRLNGGYNNYPEIRTAAAQLAIVILDTGNQAVAAPNVPFPTKVAQTSCQSSAATLGTAAQKIRVINTTTNSQWSVSMAATGGSTAKWADGAKQYSFNDPAGSGCATGQLSVNATTAAFTPRTEFTNTGVLAGSNTAFSSGVTDSIGLASANATASTNSYWDIQGIGLTQQLPLTAQPGSYAIDMTLTLVAQ